MGAYGTFKHAWNAFLNAPPPAQQGLRPNYGANYTTRPDRTRYNIANDRSIISSIYTRIAIDVASNPIRHVRLDDNGRYGDTIKSGLNECLTVEANIDQAARMFRQDIVTTLFDKGVAAIVPVDTTLDPSVSGGFDIKSLRVGIIEEWYPQHVQVNLYNDKTGRRESLILQKSFCAIVENPLYAVMNEPNSTLQRLISKLNILDAIDKQSGSGKLDLIIALPYAVKSEARKQQAEQRRSDIQFQLRDSQYGVAYTDGTEKITQLNRPVENNLLQQVQYLTEMLYGQLGVTNEVINGTADATTMLNYNNRTIEPIMGAIVEAMIRAFLTKTARSQNQSIMYYTDVFKLVPVAQIAEIADKFTRNEILSSNEIRDIIGYRPSTDPKADQLVNSNMPQAVTGVGIAPTAATDTSDSADQTSADPSQVDDELADTVSTGLDGLGSSLDDLLSLAGGDDDG